MRLRRTLWIIALALIASALVFCRFRWSSNKPGAPVFRTAQVRRGDLLATISATGTVEPTDVVDIGAQVAGMVKSFGTDKNGRPVDYSSAVEEGTVLAKIDDSLYVASLDTAKAQLEQALANRTSAEANVLQMKAKLLQAGQDWDRARRLGPSDALSQSAYDQYRTNYDTGRANLAAAEAAVKQTEAAIAQSRAAITTARINLGYCTITAPVKGVVIDRRVEIGQTVVASLSAPSLFLLAKDLKRVTVWVSVNEADVGAIHLGQPATFTVDAFPGRQFTGEVGRIRLNATMTNNVVTYTVEVNTNNDDGKLLPYLTANVRFHTGESRDVLLVPNAALRWSPAPQEMAPELRKGHGSRKKRPEQERGGREDHPKEMRGTVWVERGGFAWPLAVATGLTDGSFTEVSGKDLAEGTVVIVGEAAGEEPSGAAERSPLMPQPVGRGMRQRPGGSEGQDTERGRP